MNWKKILKDPKNQPSSGNYSDWKEQIASECFHQCVYCSIHENPWGGIDHYHIDHFRPKSKTEFKHLINDICNLYYACPICNRFKNDDWPAEPTSLDIICYPDPSKIDYSILFRYNNNDFVLSGNYKSANYIIEKLFLNRPQLIFERRESFLKNKEYELYIRVATLVEKSSNVILKNEAIRIFKALRDHLKQREYLRPYKLNEIRKSDAQKT